MLVACGRLISPDCVACTPSPLIYASVTIGTDIILALEVLGLLPEDLFVRIHFGTWWFHRRSMDRAFTRLIRVLQGRLVPADSRFLIKIKALKRTQVPQDALSD